MDFSNLRIMNAAGWCKDAEGVRKLARTPVTEITVGSITLEPRPGNEGNIFWQSPDGAYALNSLGLPNPGLAAYRTILPGMQRIARDAGKELRVSIAGFTTREYEELADGVGDYADVVEVNLGCPNVWGGDGQKPIASFNPPLMESILEGVSEILENMRGVRLAAKVSPYSDPGLFQRVLETLKGFRHFVHEIVLCNTFPNAYALAGNGPAIGPGGGLAGMSGAAMKAIALGQAVQARRALPWDDVAIVGVGGIASGADILDYARAGISAVQIGTHYFLHGERVFSELLGECVECAA